MRMTDAKVFLSSEAAEELDKIPSSDRQRVIKVIDMLANPDEYPQVNVLKLRGPLDTYLVARAGSYRIFFRYLRPDESPDDQQVSSESQQQDVMIASILRTGSNGPRRLLSRWLQSRPE
jgi:mRNA-degrading endonuclease RelE of RelBE toxin-antitoxin system